MCSLLAHGSLKALSVFQAGEQPGVPVAEGHSSVRQHWGKTSFCKAVKTLMLWKWGLDAPRSRGKPGGERSSTPRGFHL